MIGGGNYGSGNQDEGVPNLVVPTLSASAGRNRMSPGHNRDESMVADDVTVRRLTPLECCRLQGFPDDWLDGLGLSDSAKYRMLGNAVAVPVAEWIGKRLMTQHQQEVGR